MAPVCVNTRRVNGAHARTTPSSPWTLSGRTYDVILEIDGREHVFTRIPVEFSVETLLANIFHDVPVTDAED